MKSFGLLFLILIVSLSLKAQNSVAPGFDQTNYPQFSINISVLGRNMTNADILFDEAERFEKVGDYKSAIGLFSKSATKYLQNKKYVHYGTALVRLSNAYYLSNQYLNAEQVILKQALKNFNRIGSKLGQMEAYQQLAKIYSASNKLAQSLWFYTQQGILALEVHNKESHIESVLGIATIKIKKKEYDLAIKDLDYAEMLCRSSNFYQYTQQITNNRLLIANRTGKS